MVLQPVLLLRLPSVSGLIVTAPVMSWSTRENRTDMTKSMLRARELGEMHVPLFFSGVPSRTPSRSPDI